MTRNTNNKKNSQKSTALERPVRLLEGLLIRGAFGKFLARDHNSTMR